MIRASAALTTMLTARLVEADGQARRPRPPGLFDPDLGDIRRDAGAERPLCGGQGLGGPR